MEKRQWINQWENTTPKTIKLLGSAKSKITKNENGENVRNLEITEVVLVHCNIVDNNYQQNSRVLYTFAPIKSDLVKYYIFHLNILYF